MKITFKFMAKPLPVISKYERSYPRDETDDDTFTNEDLFRYKCKHLFNHSKGLPAYSDTGYSDSIKPSG